MAQAQAVPLRPRGRTGDPLAVAGGGGDPAVGTGRELERHQRPTLAHPREEPRVQPAGLGFQAAHLDRDAGRPQPRDALAVDPRVRVDGGDHGPRDAGGQHEVGAGRGAAMMRAGLEGHVGRAAARRLAGTLDRLALGMRPAAGLGPAAPDHAPVLDQHAAHGRIGPDIAQATLRQGQRHGHESPIDRTHDRRPATSACGFGTGKS